MITVGVITEITETETVTGSIMITKTNKSRSLEGLVLFTLVSLSIIAFIGIITIGILGNKLW